jgi:hypothetical protein
VIAFARVVHTTFVVDARPMQPHDPSTVPARSRIPTYVIADIEYLAIVYRSLSGRPHVQPLESV